MNITTSDSAINLLKLLFNAAQQNISSEDIKAKVRVIYRNKSFSDEEKIREIQAKINEAIKKGFWVGATLVLSVAALLTAYFKK